MRNNPLGYKLKRYRTYKTKRSVKITIIIVILILVAASLASFVVYMASKNKPYISTNDQDGHKKYSIKIEKYKLNL